MKNLTKKCISLLLSLFLVGCTTTGSLNKEKIGTVIGAAGGAMAGYLLGGKKHRTRGAIIGALAGGFIGNRIGNALDERDRQALQAKIEETLETAKVGETKKWESNHTNASGTVKVTKETTEFKKVTLKKVPNVVIAPLPPLNVASGDRRVSTALNVRKGPNTSYDIVKTLPKNAEVSLKGVTNNNWYLISKNEVVIGYVSGKYLKEIKEPAPQEQARVSINTPPNELSEVHHPTPQEEARVLINTPPIEDTAIVKVKCRTVKVRVKVDREIKEDTVKTCQDPNGSWGA